MIRRIAFCVPDEFADAFASARLRIFWDDRNDPSVDAPLGLFFGAGSLLRRRETNLRSFDRPCVWMSQATMADRISVRASGCE